MADKHGVRALSERFIRLDTAAAFEASLRLVMAFLLSRAVIFGEAAPFGAAFAAAAPTGAAGLLTALGAALGAFTGGTARGLRYTAVIILIRVVIDLFYDHVGAKRFFPCAVTFAVTGCIGAVYAYDTGWALFPTALCVVETFLAAGCALFYHVALSPWSPESGGTYGRSSHTVSTLILVSTLCMSLAAPLVFGVLSVGRTAATLIILLIMYRGGAGMGCVTAAAMGVVMDLSVGAHPVFTVCYVLSALISGVFAKNGKLLYLLSYTTASAIGVMWLWETSPMLPALYETFAASVIFLLLPETFVARLGTVLPVSGTGYGFLKAREYTRDRVELTAEAFRGLYDAVRSSAGEGAESDISVVFDRAADAVCRSCTHSGRCWNRDYADTVDVMNNLTPRLMRTGSVTEDDFPKRFAAACKSIGELTNAINSETRTYLCRRQYRARLAESRGAACSQYNDVAAILRSLAEELGSEVAVETSLERRLQRYLRGLGADAATAVFRVRGGRLRAEIRGANLRALTKDDSYLNRLSSLLGVRLCTSGEWEDGRLVLLEAEPLAVGIGVAGERRSGERVSGDKGTWFRTDEGLLYVLLADGMGSGEAAAKDAATASATLERFLRAGVQPELVMRILSDLALLRGDADVASATVDLLSVNMFSGEGKLYKYGAAPSWLVRGGTVKRLGRGTLPVGLAAASARSVPASIKLSPGSTLVMLSDGVTAGGGDEWLRELLARSDAAIEPKDLAREILNAASARGKGEDDATVIVVKITERG